jgi:HK97 family phage portal protein
VALNEDAQLIETRKYEKADICTAFGVPPIMIGDNEKTTSWGTGIEQITIGFVRYTLKPHLVRWEEELNRKLFLKAGQFVEFDVNGLLRGDTKAQADYYKAALGGPGSGPGWMSVNEVRRLENLPALPDSDQPFYPQDGSGNAQKTTQSAAS